MLRVNNSLSGRVAVLLLASRLTIMSLDIYIYSILRGRIKGQKCILFSIKHHFKV